MVYRYLQKNYVNLGQNGQNLQERMVRNADELIKYFAVDMEDMGNFNHHLQKILIPRVPGTKGSEIVRKVRCESNLFLALPIVIDFLHIYVTRFLFA